MKFLCDNCKAKYQIPDEKIAGRTLRMKCRKCDHEIILKGPKDEAEAGPTEGSQAGKRRGSSSGPAPRPAPARRSGSQAGPRPGPAVAAQARRPSSLGSDFRKGSLAPDAPAATRPPAAEWYVAINDVPVGPIKRDEVARKIGLGAVTAESLCWREGLDDWKPVGQVAELASLLQQRRVPPPPGSTSTPPPRASERPASNVVPIGGRLGAAAAPAFDEDDLQDEHTVMAPAPAAMMEPEPVRAKPAAAPKPVAVPKAKPAAAPKPVVAPRPVATPKPVVAPTPEPAEEHDPFALPPAAVAAAPAPVAFSTPPPAAAPRRGLPVGAWIAIAGAGAFGITLALAIVPKLLSDDPEPVASALPTEPVAPPTAEPVLDLVEPPEVPVEEPAVENPEVEAPTEATPRSTSMRAVSTTTSPTTTAMTATNNLTDEQRRQLELLTMSSTSGATPGMIDLGSGNSGGSTSREELDNDAVRRVVTAQSNQLALRRCYETAIRGMPEAPAVRLDVEVVVGASGTVTRADARGESVGTLTSCVEQTVRRWRFPPSSNGGRAQFPVVFSGGGR